jgi:arginase
MDMGASKRGVNLGPLAVRYTGLIENLTEMGFKVRDKGDIIPRALPDTYPGLKNLNAINEANKKLYALVGKSLAEGAFPVLLGGDHSISAGSIPAMQKHFGNIGVIWIDAHGDFNNAESSHSGNLHGMSLSAVCGFGPEEMLSLISGPQFVDPKKTVLVGGRDFDKEERVRLKDSGATVFSISDIDRYGMSEIIRRAIDIASNGTAGIHLSFDMDAVSPEGAPGVGTPVYSGLTLREAFLAAELLHESDKLLSVEMVEINAIIDQSNKTAVLAAELILSCLGKTVY